jgi:hypothetical protein
MKKLIVAGAVVCGTGIALTGLFAYWMIGVLADALDGTQADWDEDNWTLEDWAEWWGADDEE